MKGHEKKNGLVLATPRSTAPLQGTSYRLLDGMQELWVSLELGDVSGQRSTLLSQTSDRRQYVCIC